MNELVKVIEENGKQTVNARDLWEFLESEQQFRDWIKNRIKKYGFQENIDYIPFHKFMKGDDEGHGNKTFIEYHITLDMGKELSMVENNAKGRQARLYFIECEKKLADNNHLVGSNEMIKLMIQTINSVNQTSQMVLSRLDRLESRSHRSPKVTKEKPVVEMPKVETPIGMLVGSIIKYMQEYEGTTYIMTVPAKYYIRHLDYIGYTYEKNHFPNLNRKEVEKMIRDCGFIEKTVTSKVREGIKEHGTFLIVNLNSKEFDGFREIRKEYGEVDAVFIGGIL